MWAETGRQSVAAPAETRSALVTEVQRFSIHDGPGIRTTVFFKGCPLACAWCHNPETVAFDNQLVHAAGRCLGCGACAEACPTGALCLGPAGVAVDEARCQGCHACAAACPSEALRPAARRYDAAQLLDEVLRDRAFYGDSGGVTLSGGEPLAQVRFLERFLPLARAASLHVTVETSGHWAYGHVAPLLDQVDLFLFDVKAVDSARHQALVGRGNERILANLQRLLDDGRQVVVRMPFVVGANADERNVDRTGQLLASLGVRELTLLPYHGMGRDKELQLGARRPDRGHRAPTQAELAAAAATLARHGVAVP